MCSDRIGHRIEGKVRAKCEQCGMPLAPYQRRKGRRRRFCSAICRQRGHDRARRAS